MKHTATPLRVERRHSVWAIVDANGRDVGYQEIKPMFDEHGKPCGNIASRGRTPEEMKANADLWAAAPELLEACREALADCENDQWSNSPLARKLQAAIAKANGEATDA